MKNTIIFSLIIISMFFSVPSFAAQTVLTAIPNQYYTPVIAGALAQGVMEGANVGGIEAVYIVTGVALANEVINSTFFGGKFDWARIGSASLGASFVSFL